MIRFVIIWRPYLHRYNLYRRLIVCNIDKLMKIKRFKRLLWDILSTCLPVSRTLNSFMKRIPTTIRWIIYLNILFCYFNFCVTPLLIRDISQKNPWPSKSYRKICLVTVTSSGQLLLSFVTNENTIWKNGLFLSDLEPTPFGLQNKNSAREIASIRMMKWWASNMTRDR